MDLYCPNCGEPWDHDSLHEEAGERYGVPFYLSDEDRRAWTPRERNPAYDSDAYQPFYKAVRAEFQTNGCAALASFGAKCSEPSTDTDTTFGLTRQDAAAAMYELLGDDTDGAAAMLEDMGF